MDVDRPRVCGGCSDERPDTHVWDIPMELLFGIGIFVLFALLAVVTAPAPGEAPLDQLPARLWSYSHH